MPYIPSFQHLPGHPRDRIHLGAKPGDYGPKKLYDPTIPATNNFQDWQDRNSNFTADLSRSKMDLFLKSPRDFWLKYHEGYKEQIDSPSWTINDRIGTLAEAHFDEIRANGNTATSPLLAGTIFDSAKPFIHPSNPDFIEILCGRRPNSWSHVRTLGVLHQRTSDPHAMLNVYGEPDDILEMEDEHGNPVLVIVDFKAGSKHPPNLDYSKWFTDKYHVGYRVQLEFYAWLLEQIIARDNLPHRVHPVGANIHLNIGRSQDTLFPSGGSPELTIDHELIPVELDWSWVGPTLDLAIECILDTTPPPVQQLPMRQTRWPDKAHDNWVFSERYEWLMNNHPGSWP